MTKLGGNIFSENTHISRDISVATVEAMKLLSPAAGIKVTTTDYRSTRRGGGAEYLIKTAAQATTDGDVFSASTTGNLLLANGNVAIVRLDEDVFTSKYGTFGDGVTDDTSAILEAIAKAAQLTGQTRVLAPHSTLGYVISSTLEIPSFVTLDFQLSELLPKAISLGGSYTSNAAIIVGSSGVVRQEASQLVRTKIVYDSQSSDFPARPITINQVNNGYVAYNTVKDPNDTCFFTTNTNNLLVEHNSVFGARFHGFAESTDADRTVYQFNTLLNLLGGVENDSFCFDISAPDGDTVDQDTTTIVRFNKARNCLRFYKGQNSSTEVYGNYMREFTSTTRQVVVIGYRNAINFYDNVMVDCRFPFLIGSGTQGPVENAVIRDNTILNFETPIQQFMTFNASVKNVRIEGNYINHPTNFIASASFWEFDQALASNITIVNNEFILSGATTTDVGFLFTAFNDSTFSHNKITTGHLRAFQLTLGSGNSICDNEIISTGGTDVSLRIVTGGNVVNNNTLWGGRFKFDNFLNTRYSGNTTSVTSSPWIDTPENERPQTGTATPIGSVTPRFIGDDFLDTAASKFYKANGLTNNDWLILN